MEKLLKYIQIIDWFHQIGMGFQALSPLTNLYNTVTKITSRATNLFLAQSLAIHSTVLYILILYTIISVFILSFGFIIIYSILVISIKIGLIIAIVNDKYSFYNKFHIVSEK